MGGLVGHSDLSRTDFRKGHHPPTHPLTSWPRFLLEDNITMRRELVGHLTFEHKAHSLSFGPDDVMLGKFLHIPGLLSLPWFQTWVILNVMYHL